MATHLAQVTFKKSYGDDDVYSTEYSPFPVYLVLFYPLAGGSTVSEILVDCAWRYRLRKDGDYFMMVRRNELERGRRVLMPPGGGVRATACGLEALRQENIVLPSPFDLRFSIPDTKQAIKDITSLVSAKDNREKSPRREFEEEFYKERQWLSLSDVRDVKKAKLTTRGLKTFTTESVRHATRGQKTLYFVYVYDVVLSSHVLSKLTEAIEKDRMGEFVTEAELWSGISKLGGLIHPMYVKYLPSRATR